MIDKNFVSICQELLSSDVLSKKERFMILKYKAYYQRNQTQHEEIISRVRKMYQILKEASEYDCCNPLSQPATHLTNQAPSQPSTKPASPPSQPLRPTHIIGQTKKKTSPFFDKFWVKYPRKIKKSVAATRFKNKVKTKADHENVFVALDHYLKYLEQSKGGTEARYVMHPATWLSSWEDWIEGAPEEKSIEEQRGIDSDFYDFLDSRKAKGEKQ